MGTKREGDVRKAVKGGGHAAWPASARPSEPSGAAAGSAPSSTGASQVRMVLGLVVALAAVLAIWTLSAQLFREDGDGGGVAAEAAALLDVAADEVTGLSWTDGDGAAAVSLVRGEDGVWRDASDPDASLDQELVESVVAAVVGLTVGRAVDADDVTDEMGAADPTATATLTLSDGTEVGLTVGAATSDGGESYVWVDDDGTAYLVDDTLASVCALTVADLYETEAGPQAATADVTSLTVARADGTLTLLHYPDGTGDLSYTDDYTWFADDGSGATAADAAGAQTLVGLVNDVSWASCVDATYDGSNAADYGLDNPTLTAMLVYTAEDEGTAAEQTFVLVVGAQAQDGGYYAQPQGSDRVYTLGASTVEQLLAATVASLAPDDVLLMDWDTVDSIDVAYGGTTRTLSLVRTADDAETSDGSDDGTDDAAAATGETAYTVDGTEVLALKAENLLAALDNLDAEGEADGSVDVSAVEPELTFTFHRSTEAFAELTLSLIPYDNSFYLVSFNDEQRLLVNKNDVARLVELYEDLCGDL